MLNYSNGLLLDQPFYVGDIQIKPKSRNISFVSPNGYHDWIDESGTSSYNKKDLVPTYNMKNIENSPFDLVDMHPRSIEIVDVFGHIYGGTHKQKDLYYSNGGILV